MPDGMAWLPRSTLFVCPMATLPPGRHVVTLEGVGAPATALLLAAPRCPTTSGLLGAFMPLHAVRTEEDWGIGTYTDLGRLGAWLSARGVDLLATLPLYPAFLDPPADPSPYLPVSRLAYNEVFIDPIVLPEFEACPEAQRLWSGPLREKVSALRLSRLVAYEDVAKLMRTVLEPMSLCASDGSLPQRQAALRTFASRHPELGAYARFRARVEHHAMAKPDEHEQVTAYHLYCQWVAHEQLAETTGDAGYFADLPVGSHPHGFDPEWSPASFVPNVHGGSPPDLFFPGGQDWGFNPLHPARIREDGYRFVSALLARAFDHAACVRIDHVMGLQRLYMIPEDTGGRGAYVEYRPEEMHALVALEASRSGAVVVGEDLGTVPPEVRPRLERDGILRTWVFQFESTESCPLPPPPDLSLATLGTHDLPRFAAFLWGEDTTDREKAGELSPVGADAARQERAAWRRRLFAALGIVGEGPRQEVTALALEGCLRHLARSQADVALVDLEDLWGERTRENVPGTGPEAANWRRRSARTLEQLEADTAVARLLESLAEERVA